MSRNRPLTRPEDGVCPVTGLDVPDDDGQLVRFPEKTGRVVTRQMVKTEIVWLIVTWSACRHICAAKAFCAASVNNRTSGHRLRTVAFLILFFLK
jgi:hypothetical protein